MARKAKKSSAPRRQQKRKADVLDQPTQELATDGQPTIDDSWEAPYIVVRRIRLIFSTEQEWEEKFRRYKSFRLPGSDENYRIGEFVYIFQGDSQPPPQKKGRQKKGPADEHDEANDPNADPSWIAQIEEVRAMGERSVYMRARWLYTTIKQLQEIKATPIPRRLEGHEVFYSDATDILPVHVVDDRAIIHAFDETSAVQNPIPADAVFYRKKVKTEGTTADAKNKGKNRPTVEAFHPPTCFCKKPYIPLPLDTQPMIYCPSISCRKWFHCECLNKRSLDLDPSPTQLDELRSSGLDLVDELPDFDLKDQTEVAGLTKINDVPEEVLSSATQSILRGSETTGITGNGQRVILARDIVQAKKKNKDITLPMMVWAEKMKDSDFAGDAATSKNGDITLWRCPDCKSVI